MPQTVADENAAAIRIFRFVFRGGRKRAATSSRADVPNGGLVCFCGTTPNVGTTVVAFGTAVELARRTEDPVAYLCLNLKSSKIHRYLGVDDPASSLDELRAELKARALSPDRLREKAWRAPAQGLPANLRVMFGNRLREQADYFAADDVSHLLENARRAFRLCVVDVHAFWDNAATVTAMRDSDTRLLVTTPDLTHFQEDMDRWFKTLAPVAGVPASDVRLVLNRPNGPGNAGFNATDVCRETGMRLAAAMPHCPEILPLLNQGRLGDVFRRPVAIAEGIRKLADRLVVILKREGNPGRERGN